MLIVSIFSFFEKFTPDLSSILLVLLDLELQEKKGLRLHTLELFAVPTMLENMNVFAAIRPYSIQPLNSNREQDGQALPSL